MIRFFQSYKFDQSKYDRPTRDWVCGWARDGKACHVGPDGGGRCIAAYECTPIKKSDRWSCARAKEFGGRCRGGPLPDGTCCNPIPRCQPVRSLRARRGALSKWASFLALGLLLLFAAGPAGPDFISPGGLTSHHMTAANSCGNCHSAFGGGPAGWIRAAFAIDRKRDDSKLCFSCHILGEHGGSPHGIPESRLSRSQTKRTAAPASAEMFFADMLNLNGERGPGASVACATCHQEHRGRDADLTDMNTLRCQSCHRTRFMAFGRGHPEFKAFPYSRRTRLIFDHASHLNKHFMGEAKERAPTTCKSCHTSGTGGTYMKVVPFEKACAACHEGQILGESSAGEKGIPIITLPGLDAESLEKAKVGVGAWPRDAEGEGLTPFMRLLLSADPKFREAEAFLEGKEVDLLDLSGAGAPVKAAAGKLAWTVKRLVFDLATQGQKAVKARLGKALGRRLGQSEFSRLSGQIPVGVLRGAMAAWFPGLASEMSLRAEGKRPGEGDKESEPKEEEEGELPLAEEVSVAGGWYVQDFSLYYRPTGHEDRFLRGWLDLTASEAAAPETVTAPGARRGIFTALSGEKAIGFCVKCHSIDRVDEKSYRVNWKPKGPPDRFKEFTRYRHTPHFSLLDEKGCLTCHKMDPEAKYMGGFKDFDPATFASNFRPIPKAVCAACHSKAGASDKCLTCHNYHIGKVVPALMSAPLRMPEPAN